MSFLANEWASESAPVADVYERVILGKLANHANDDGTGAWPSVASMARAALCSNQTIYNRLRELKKRALIAHGDQRLVSHYPDGKRPVVYDLLIPVGWYSEQQLAKVNRERADAGKPPLTKQDRPLNASAPPKKQRSDKGKSNPKRSPKQQAPTDPSITLRGPNKSLTPQSHWGQPLNVIDPNPSMSLTQIRPFEPVHVTRPSGARAGSAPTPARTNERAQATTSGADGQLHEPEEAKTPERPSKSVAESLLADPKLYDDLVAIDLLPVTRPVQRKQYTQLVKAIDAALLRFPKAKVKRYLQIKARDRKGVQWVTRAFTDYADAIKQVHVPHEEPPKGRTNNGEWFSKSAANPPKWATDGDDAFLDFLAVKAAEQPAQDAPTNRRAADQLAGRRQPEQAPEVDQPSQVSPVSWLSDDQFEKLSPQDKAHVRNAGDAPIDQLRPAAAKRVTAIQRAVDGVAV